MFNMKKYIIPTTQFIALGAEKLCQGLSGSINGGNPWNSDSPQRQFSGDYYSSLKYLI